MAEKKKLQIPTPRVFVPLLEPARYKGAHGGRGSGKSHFFAELAVERCLLYPGTRGVCIREVQKSLRESVKLLIEDKIDSMGVSGSFKKLQDSIIAPGGGVLLFQGMADHTAESIKSLEGFDFSYAEEAQTLTDRSIEFLRPTIRKDPVIENWPKEKLVNKRAVWNPHKRKFDIVENGEVIGEGAMLRPGSELWFAWNRRHQSDPVDRLLTSDNPPKDSIVVVANWRNNPFFPDVLEEERQYDEIHNPQRYAHIWEGEYEPTAVGAIFDRQTIADNRRTEAPALSRIVVAIDPAISAEALSDETGIIVCALGTDGRGYVIGDYSLKGAPEKWASAAIAAYDLHEADAIICEVNQGGDMVESTIKAVRNTVRIIKVRATRGKHVRAEPISALYKLGRVSHIGSYPVLEAQLCLTTAQGYEGQGSPDRLDAMVWGFSELFPKLIKPMTKDKLRPTRQNDNYNPHRRHG